jgi:hypothetical protein
MQIPKPQTSCYSLLFGVIVAHVLLSSFSHLTNFVALNYHKLLSLTLRY